MVQKTKFLPARWVLRFPSTGSLKFVVVAHHAVSPLQRKLIICFIGFTAALAGLLFGLDIGVISGALPFVKNAFAFLSDTWLASYATFYGVETHPELGYFAIFALLIFIIGFAMSAGPIIWILCSEIYPLTGRDLGVTFSTATNWIANAIVGMTCLSLPAGFGNGNTFLLYGGPNVLFIIFFVIFVPETKGVSLEKIEANLLSRLPLRQIGRPPRTRTTVELHETNNQ